MLVLQTIAIGFMILETANVLALYFFPGSRVANSVGIFNAWEKSKRDPEVHRLIRYLANWVAGTKLIFILLLAVILYAGDDRTILLAALALTISIASFFWRLFPLIRTMDAADQITPRRYSVKLGWMILAIILALSLGIISALNG